MSNLVGFGPGKSNQGPLGMTLPARTVTKRYAFLSSPAGVGNSAGGAIYYFADASILR